MANIIKVSLFLRNKYNNRSTNNESSTIRTQHYLFTFNSIISKIKKIYSIIINIFLKYIFKVNKEL